MKISHILSEKNTQTLLTITSDATIADAACRLSQERVGSLIVSDDGKKLIGILSERDIVRELGIRGEKCLHSCVKDYMTREVKTLTRNENAQDALEVMSKGRFRHLPIVEDGQLIGLISIGDVVSARLKQIELENNALSDMISGQVF